MTGVVLLSRELFHNQETWELVEKMGAEQVRDYPFADQRAKAEKVLAELGYEESRREDLTVFPGEVKRFILAAEQETPKALQGHGVVTSEIQFYLAPTIDIFLDYGRVRIQSRLHMFFRGEFSEGVKKRLKKMMKKSRRNLETNIRLLHVSPAPWVKNAPPGIYMTRDELAGYKAPYESYLKELAAL